MEFELNFWIFMILFVTAIAAGFIDAVAGGGGMICLPVLLSLGIPAHIALATNKLQGSFGTFVAVMTFYKKGMINFKEIWRGILFTFLGAIFGTLAVLVIDAKILNYIMPILLFLIFIYTIFSPNLGENDKNALMNEKIFYLIFGLTLGFYDGFFGPGAGSFWTFSFVCILGVYMRKAVANAKVMNFTSNIVSLFVFICGGQVLWLVGFVMAIGQAIGAYLGSIFVIKKDIKFIKIIFLCVVGATILNIIYKNFLA